jgi:hypothetical protein
MQKLNIANTIYSGWNKPVTYKVSNNVLTVIGLEGAQPDADSIYIGEIDNCDGNLSLLKVKILQIYGCYPWGNKIIGFSFARDKLRVDEWGNNFPSLTPERLKMESGFIDNKLSRGDVVEYEIRNMGKSKIFFGAKVFVFGDNRAEFRFDVT